MLKGEQATCSRTARGDGWAAASCCSLPSIPVIRVGVSQLSGRNYLAVAAFTDVLHSGVKRPLQSSSAARFLRLESAGLTTWKERRHGGLTDILQPS